MNDRRAGIARQADRESAAGHRPARQSVARYRRAADGQNAAGAPPLALAAAIAMAAAGLASFFTWAVLQSRTVPQVVQTVAAKNSFEEPRDPKYVRARDSVEKTFHERLALLAPATRAKIESSLAVIKKAHEDIRKALAADPQSPLLEQLWESTWQDEFDLYDRVVQATQPPMIRI